MSSARVMRLAAAALACLLTVAPFVNAQQSETAAERERLLNEYRQQQGALKDAHWQKLAEIDARFNAAIAEFREENVARSVALGEDYRQAREKLGQQNLDTAERDEKARELQAENTAARAEYAEWRDATYTDIQDRHAADRQATFEQYDVDSAALLARYQESVANLRSAGAGPKSGMLPARPEPQPVVQTPDVEGPPPGPIEAQIVTEVDAEINTSVAPPEYDIALYSLDRFAFYGLEDDGAEFLADRLDVYMFVANRGNETYAFGGNVIKATLVEGRVNHSGLWVDAGAADVGASAEHRFGIPVSSAQLATIQLEKQNYIENARNVAREGAARVASLGLKGSKRFDESKHIRIKPGLWYTADVRLTTPEQYDDDPTNHGAYFYLRFGSAGEILEKQGPHFFAPPASPPAGKDFVEVRQ